MVRKHRPLLRRLSTVSPRMWRELACYPQDIAVLGAFGQGTAAGRNSNRDTAGYWSPALDWL